MPDVVDAGGRTRYRPIEPIGEGRQSRVWRAHDVPLGREVAVKEIALEERRHAWAVKEAGLLTRLRHPAIVAVHEVFADGQNVVVVMDLVRGRSLAETLRQEGRLPPERVARIGLYAAWALDAAHRAGFAHRGLDPGQILLEGDRALVTDFWSATLRRADEEPRRADEGNPWDDLWYLAPERITDPWLAGEPVDLWALGAVLYTAVEGRPPYRDPDPVSGLRALLTEPPQPPEHAGPLAPLLSRLLDRDPGRRGTAAQAVSTLEAVAAPGP